MPAPMMRDPNMRSSHPTSIHFSSLRKKFPTPACAALNSTVEQKQNDTKSFLFFRCAAPMRVVHTTQAYFFFPRTFFVPLPGPSHSTLWGSRGVEKGHVSTLPTRRWHVSVGLLHGVEGDHQLLIATKLCTPAKTSSSNNKTIR